MSLINEHKRRNVLRVGITHAVSLYLPLLKEIGKSAQHLSTI